jgi:hypothetical protein
MTPSTQRALVEALLIAETRLVSCARTYNADNFTDRHGEGPLLIEAVNIVRAALARAEQEAKHE